MLAFALAGHARRAARCVRALSPMPFSLTPLVISRGHASHHNLLVVAGELDLGTAPQLRREVDATLSGGISTLHLDLAGVSFIDCTGLRALIAVQSELRLRGGELLLRRTSEQVDRLCALTVVHFDLVGPLPMRR